MTMMDAIWFRPFEIVLLKTLVLSELRVLWFRLFYFFICGKKEFSKISHFAQSWGMFSEFLVKYLVFGERSNSKR